MGIGALVAWQRFTSPRTNQDGGQRSTTQQYSPTADDPVTGNKVGIAHAITANFEGKTYFFESESSRAIFQQDPERYVHRHHRHHDCC
ncbi:YHS domain-containing protein [Cupriavidus necator]|uniref:YHS domain-containing protein n=1 Tax=Cupriavidus necator TaxID=106590 RepID=UPI001F1A8D76|nr:YHS domain-containing protein [Cupriavidus necator]